MITKNPLNRVGFLLAESEGFVGICAVHFQTKIPTVSCWDLAGAVGFVGTCAVIARRKSLL